MPQQKQKRKILFVCSANLNRSPTFEKFFKIKLSDKYDIRSAGTYYGYPYQINKDILDWADKVYVMDLSHSKFIYEKYPDSFHKIQIVGVSDQYDAESPELIRLIEFWYLTTIGKEGL